MDRFFFFGTLMDRDVLELVLDRPVTERDLSPARLNGFARRRIAKDSFPVLIKASFLKVSRIYMDCFGKMTPEEAEDIWQNARREHQPLAAD